VQAEDFLAELETAVLKLAAGASAADEERDRVIYMVLTLRW